MRAITCWSQILASMVRPGFSKIVLPSCEVLPVLSGCMLLAERTCVCKRGDALVVIAQCVAQDLFGVLAQQRRRRRVDRRCQTHIERRFDVGDHARSRVRNLADAMPF